MIHMGSDHRCIMATFLINTPGKNTHARRENKKHETIGYVEHEQKAKNTNIEMSELEERYQEIVDTIKKAAAKKGNKVHDTGNNAKDQVERENAAAAAEAESTLVEAVAQEIERRSMKRSSTVANQRGVPAQLEHGRQDGWTSTPRGSDDEKKGSESVTTAGERLKNQRPHSSVKIEDEEDAHEVVTGSGCSGGCDFAGRGATAKNNAHTVTSILNTIQKNILEHKSRIRMKRQVLSCSIPAATRASSRTTTKKHT